jgi:hypothetical protein
VTRASLLPLALTLTAACYGDAPEADIAAPVDTSDADGLDTDVTSPDVEVTTEVDRDDAGDVDGAMDTTEDVASGGEVVLPCEPVADEGCVDDETCTWASLDAEEPTCEPAGPGAPGDPCSTEAGCAAGVCLDLNGTGSVCHVLCEAAEDCGDQAPCQALEGLPFDICERWSVYVVCLLLDPTTCPEARGCYLVGDHPDPVCLVPGAGQPGEACDVANGCEAGGACVEGMCRSLCDPAAGEPCLEPLQTCAPYYQGAGVCLD